MKKLGIVALALAAAPFAGAQLHLSIGLRETGAGGGAAFSAIGANGGSTGGIEFIDLDIQPLVLDGTWQFFSFTLSSATVTAFAGATANSVLDGSYGVLEMIRIRNTVGTSAPVTLYIDDVANTITPAGGGPVTTTFGDFESYNAGVEAIFQEPNFSGSTSGNVVAGGTSLVTDEKFHAGTKSDKIQFQFVDSSPTRWIRLTTFNTPNLPNPQVRFDQNSVISFWAMGVPEPGTMTALGLAAAALLARRRKK